MGARQRSIKVAHHRAWLKTPLHTTKPRHKEIAIASDECIFLFDEELEQERILRDQITSDTTARVDVHKRNGGMDGHNRSMNLPK